MRAAERDYEAIVELAEECFPRDKELGGMVPRWGHCFRREKMSNSLIIKEAGKIIAHVGLVDQTVMAGAAEIRVAGVSSVCTEPGHRGSGLMTGLLHHADTFMRQEGYALSDLGGDRLRYGRFGWELAGREWNFRITPRSSASLRPPTGFLITEFKSTEEERSTLEIHSRQRIGVKRDEALHHILLNRVGKEVLLAWKGDDLDSYLVLRADTEEDIKQARVEEVGGSPDGIHSIIAHLLTRGAEAVSVAMPWQHPANPTLRELSSGWLVNSWRMMKVVDLRKTLLGFRDMLLARYRRAGFDGERTAVIPRGDGGRVELRISEDDIVLHQSGKHNDTGGLSGRELVALLFGADSSEIVGRLPENCAFLQALLPIDFYIWRNETV